MVVIGAARKGIPPPSSGCTVSASLGEYGSLLWVWVRVSWIAFLSIGSLTTTFLACWPDDDYSGVEAEAPERLLEELERRNQLIRAALLASGSGAGSHT